METITRTFNVYRFHELNAKAKENVTDTYFRYDPSYGEWMREERIEALKALAKAIQGKLDYSIALVADRGERIVITDYDLNLLYRTINSKECNRTGCCYDIDLNENILKWGLQEGLDKYLSAIHKEYESMLEEDCIKEYCDSNELRFLENGDIYNG